MRNATIACVSVTLLALSLAACDRLSDENEGEASPTYGLTADEEVISEPGSTPEPARTASAQAAFAPAQERRPAQSGKLNHPAAAASTKHLQAVHIMDPSGFAQPVVAANAQIPQGWKLVGGIQWNPGTPCGNNQLRINWGAVAPDQITAIGALPGFNWQVAGAAQQFNPCPVVAVRGAREFLEATARNLRQGAQIQGYEDQTAEAMRQLKQPLTAGKQLDAGQLLIAYTENGVPMQELLRAAVHFSTVGSSTMGQVYMVYGHRARAGQLDAELFSTVVASVQGNPEWQQAAMTRISKAIKQHHDGINADINAWNAREMAKINARGAADRAAIRAQTNREIAAINSQTAANTAATNDRIHRRTLEGIGEYNTYNGVGGSTVQSSIHGGARVFQDANNPNRAYSTNQPYAQPSGGYVELERRR